MTISVVLINQNVSFGLLESFCQEHPECWVLVTTQEMFPSEVKRTNELSHPPSLILRDRDLLDETDFVEIDKQVCSAFMTSGRAFAYPDEINEAILVRRATILQQRIKLRLKEARVDFFHAHGLGIPAAWWRAQGSTPIQESTEIDPPSTRPRLLEFYEKFRRSERWSHMAFSSGERYVLGGRLDRIFARLPHDVKIRTASIGERLRFFSQRCPATGPGTIRFASPAHDYSPSLRRKTLILQDGHMPRDYSHSILYSYPKSDSIVPSNPFAEAWIIRGGLVPQRIPGFSDPEFSPPGKVAKSITNVLLVLQHAGDWSPFVYRCDTDRMVIDFIRLAKENPALSFTIRPHPTMVHPAHEGPRSLDRIRIEIEYSAQPNLTISNGSLEDDFNWANVVVSEYSQALLEAWRTGRLGIIYNPTGRRSFMKEFEEIGFPRAESSEDIVRLVKSARSLSEQQETACHNYNRIISQWRKNCG
jgi:hypothetical protein